MKRPTINCKIKNNDIGRNIAISGFDNKDRRYDIGDNGQTL